MDLNEFKAIELVHSSVMVMHELSSDSLILTKRSEHLRTHPGEVCFPGGAWETTDQSLYDTALRELYEELGITADRITLVKELKIEKTLLGEIIHPWFATIESISPYRINTQEVSYLIAIPMSLAQDPQNYRDFIVKRYARQFISCEFIANKELVWGATAKIMKQLVLMK